MERLLHDTTAENSRIVKRKINDEWVPCSMLDLKSGDLFRMTEADGTPVVDFSGCAQWRAAGEPFETNGIHGIEIERPEGAPELSLAERATNYETLLHIQAVQGLLLKFSAMLSERGLTHDQSKLVPPEVDTFTIFTPKLRSATYGSDEYKQFLEEMSPALQNHYKHNSHHPEHYGEAGVDGMSLFDVVEMLVDWIASTRRTKDGNIYKSFKINQERFNMSPQLVALMRNTVKILCPEIQEPEAKPKDAQ